MSLSIEDDKQLQASSEDLDLDLQQTTLVLVNTRSTTSVELGSLTS